MRILTRAHQQLIWDRTRQTNRLRSALREYFPGCRDFYQRRRAAGDLHHQALRALGNRLVGYLHGCLRTRTCYDEATA